MIEIRVNKSSKSKESYELVIDGVIIDNDDASIHETSEHSQFPFMIFTSTLKTSEIIAAHSLSDMAQPYSLSMVYRFDWFDCIDRIYLSPVDVADNDKENKELSYSVTLDFGRFSAWRGIYSFDDYFQELNRIINSKEELGISSLDLGNFPDFMERPYSLELGSISTKLPIATEISRLSNTFRVLHDEVEKALSSRKHINAVVMSFDFPEEVRVSCEQYLLYFGKFLNDLGVQATSDLQHEAGQVLFTVTPTDSQIALDKIRTALDVYLQLPSSPVTDSTHNEIAIQRLESNVFRLKSDLKLAAAELQAKNTTIEAQRLIIDTQKGLLSGEVIFTSVKDVTPKPNDKEELIRDTLAIIPYRGKGFEINLPEIFRRLKKLFKED